MENSISQDRMTFVLDINNPLYSLTIFSSIFLPLDGGVSTSVQFIKERKS